ncbi:nitronate monooxygenase, partial [Singulisphaera rosea]
SPQHRAALLGGMAAQTALTRGFTGRLGRGIKNRLMEELNRPGTEFLPYPLQRHLMKHLSRLAERAGQADFIPLWAGQSANLTRHRDATTLLNSLISDVTPIAEAVLRRRESR